MNILLIILIIIILVTYMNGCNNCNDQFVDIPPYELNIYQLEKIEVKNIKVNDIPKFNENQLPIILGKLSPEQKKAITPEQKKKLSAKDLALL